MKVLMLGWEFPPFISGGLGTACFGLTKAMSQLGNVDVTFVLPRPIRAAFSTHVRLLAPDAMPSPRAAVDQAETEPETTWALEGINNVTFRTAAVEGFSVYAKPTRVTRRATAGTRPRVARFHVVEPGQQADQLAQQTQQPVAKGQPQSFVTAGTGDIYGDMIRSVENYKSIVLEIAAEADFDVIHAHDWMTYPAGMAAAAVTGKPLVVHVHSTEFDRSGVHVNQWVYDIERAGMHNADRIVAVSHLTKSICISRYGVPGDKIEVVYNAVEMNGTLNGRNGHRLPAAIGREEKIVLFLGRVTMQKGPDYFLAAARKVLDIMPNVRFIIAGSGDMIRRTVEMAVNMGIGHKVLFTGFLRGDDVARVFKMADVYVMPSVSEPFGIAPLEALSHDVPTIISKQSGVSEVLTHVLKVDFWDVDEIANKIVAVLRHPPLRDTLKQHSSLELRKLSWLDSAKQCVKVYEEASYQHAAH